MYPVKLGVDAAKRRIARLIENGHHAEALVTSVFTFEKTVHRTLKQLIVSAGFPNAHADALLGKIRGFHNQKDIWACFDTEGRDLPTIIGNSHWQHVNNAVKMRNKLVHGSHAYSLNRCKVMSEKILELIDQTVFAFRGNYGYDGWSRVSVRRNATLHSDPKVCPTSM